MRAKSKALPHPKHPRLSGAVPNVAKSIGRSLSRVEHERLIGKLPTLPKKKKH